jgi:hypothetical protein
MMNGADRPGTPPRLFTKLGVADRVQAVLVAVTAGTPTPVNRGS